MIKETEIFWDIYDVPHIFASDIPNLFYAYGLTQMRNYGNLILRLYGQARGRASEYWGKQYLLSDRWVRRMEIPLRSAEWYQLQSPVFQTYLIAFTDALNDYVRDNPERIQEELKLVLPLSPSDIIAHAQRVVNFSYVVDSTIGMNLRNKSVAGSNAWAISPSMSKTGSALLLSNPHLPWTDLFLLYEAHLNIPGINSYGVTPIGFPVQTIAFNDFLGWTHTVNPHTGWTIYELDSDGNRYLMDGNYHLYDTREEVIKIKNDDKTYSEEKFVIRKSRHGTIIKEEAGKAYSLRVAGLDRPRALEQWWKMDCATSLNEFEDALKELQIPTFTVIYADREGNIMHFFNGHIPVRMNTNEIIPGSKSSDIWSEIHPYSDLPRVINPSTGWLQNANDPPWTTTFPQMLKADEFPVYFAPRGPMSLRAQQSVKLITKNEKLSLEDIVHLKFDTFIELTTRVLDELIAAAAGSPDPTARKAAATLSVWERKLDSDSRGAVLFIFWTVLITPEKIFRNEWDENNPLTTPSGLLNAEDAVSVLIYAASKIEEIYGTVDVKWGDVFRLSTEGVNTVVEIIKPPLGIFAELWLSFTDDARFMAVGGDCYTAVIEFSNPVRAMALNIYGNSTDSNSFSGNRQMEMFLNKQMRLVCLTREELMKQEIIQDRSFYSAGNGS